MKLNYTQITDLANINDSMELNSHTIIAQLEGKLFDGTTFNVWLEVQGYVSVVYKGELYNSASEMPKELIELFHKGGYSSEDVCVNENNWFELTIEENETIVSSDVIDAGGLESGEVLEMLLDAYREIGGKI